MVLHRVEEFQITEALHQKIQSLLQTSFDSYPESQDYLHQTPTFRYLLLKDKKLIGHLAVDHRVIQNNSTLFSIFGITDLCIHPEYQHQKSASKLIKELDSLAKSHKVDALVLFTDLFSFYEKHGFVKQQNKCRWLMIQNNVSLGVARRSLENCLMVKIISDKTWDTEAELDLLGHVF